MQIKLTRSQAQKHIIDVAHLLTAGTDDVVVTLPDVWQTKPPTVPGHYWTWAATARNVYLMELSVKYGGLCEEISDLALEDMQIITHWFGPLPEPEPPIVDDDDGLPCGAVPKVAGAGGAIFDDDDD